MFLRLLFVFLAALNIAVGAWLVLGQPYARGGYPADPGVRELRLLSEMAESPSTAPLSTAMAEPAPSMPAAGNANYEGCLALGPFATPQDLRDARRTLTPHVLRMRSRQEQASQNVGWWVYMPAAASHAQALATARLLDAGKINDYYVVSTGVQANTISLGLFKEAANASKRLEQVNAAGFSAKMSERSETVPQYWLDLRVADRDHFNWRGYVSTTGVGSHSAGCF